MISTILAATTAPNPFDKSTFTTLENNIPGFRFAGGNINQLFSGNYGIVNLVFFIAGAIILLYSISAGIGFMTSRGDPGAVNSSKQKLTNAIVGFLIVLAAYWIVQLIATILGLQTVTSTFSG